MNHRFLLLTQVAVLAFAPAVLAHGNGVHLMGQVRAVSETSLSVETKDGKELTLALDAKTAVEQGGKSATAHDIAVGQRVVVHARKDGNSLVAQVIKLSRQTQPSRSSNPDGGTKEKEQHDHSNH